MDKFAIVLDSLSIEAASLPKGAAPPDINAFEKSVGFELPDGLRRMYLSHDGEREYVGGSTIGQGIFCGYEFRSLTHARAEIDAWRKVRETTGSTRRGFEAGIPSHPENAVRGEYSRRGWIPFAGGYGGAQLAIDFEPDTDGVLGQVINFGRDDFVHFKLADSFDGFLDTLLHQYANRQWHPLFLGSEWSLYDELVKKINC